MMAAPLPNVQNSSPAASLRHNLSTDTVMDDPSNGTQEGKNAPRCVFAFPLYLNSINIYGVDLWSLISYVLFYFYLQYKGMMINQRFDPVLDTL